MVVGDRGNLGLRRFCSATLQGGVLGWQDARPKAGATIPDTCFTKAFRRAGSIHTAPAEAQTCNRIGRGNATRRLLFALAATPGSPGSQPESPGGHLHEAGSQATGVSLARRQ